MKLKETIIPILLTIIIIIEIFFIDKISNYAANIIDNQPKIVINPSNTYHKDYDFLFVKESKDFIPYSYNDLVNIFFTIINNGWDEFTFYCPKEYEKCITDVKNISTQDILLTEINNFASPFNSFQTFYTTYDDAGEVTIKLSKIYSEDKIKEINEIVDEILLKTTNENMTIEEKIKNIHDYIINHTKYDIVKNNTGKSQYESNTAYGALLNGYATCNGYADTMAIILDRLGVKNYRLTSSNHIWNGLYLNDSWVHLDLTWDDPVSDDGKEYLYHKYFLIDNEQLKKEDKQLIDHIFDSSVYLEFKD